ADYRQGTADLQRKKRSADTLVRWVILQKIGKSNLEPAVAKALAGRQTLNVEGKKKSNVERRPFELIFCLDRYERGRRRGGSGFAADKG
ncbi:MAG: hypothetical protein JJU29_17750, partial [Verrucomicrobia bacterium]|nr:hypothetical protein [Verrucomicrobiota bacterium]